MIRILYRHPSGTVMDLPESQLAAATRDSQATLWIDVLQPTAVEYDLVLKQSFQFHPLAVEDAIKDSHVPKLDDYGSYLFLVVHTIHLGDEAMDFDTFEIDVFLGPNYLITLHHEPMANIDRLWLKQHHSDHGLARGPAMMLYELLDRQVDTYIPLLEHFEQQLENLGDLIFQPGVTQSEQVRFVNQILTAKSSALRLRRILGPQRDLMNRLARDDYGVVPARTHIYFRDVYDHMLRVADLAESMRDLASSTMETHLTLVSNRLNGIMKVLTIISTVFMPLSFLAAVYGMNFRFMPELEIGWAYPLLWLIFLAIALAMLRMFRSRRWL